jgi:hypothetical protein
VLPAALPLGCVPRIPVVPVAPRAPELDGTEVDCPGLGAGVGPVSLGIRLAFVSVVAGVPALDGKVTDWPGSPGVVVDDRLLEPIQALVIQGMAIPPFKSTSRLEAKKAALRHELIVWHAIQEMG